MRLVWSAILLSLATSPAAAQALSFVPGALPPREAAPATADVLPVGGSLDLYIRQVTVISGDYFFTRLSRLELARWDASGRRFDRLGATLWPEQIAAVGAVSDPGGGARVLARIDDDLALLSYPGEGARPSRVNLGLSADGVRAHAMVVHDGRTQVALVGPDYKSCPAMEWRIALRVVDARGRSVGDTICTGELGRGGEARVFPARAQSGQVVWLVVAREDDRLLIREASLAAGGRIRLAPIGEAAMSGGAPAATQLAPFGPVLIAAKDGASGAAQILTVRGGRLKTEAAPEIACTRGKPAVGQERSDRFEVRAGSTWLISRGEAKPRPCQASWRILAAG